MSKEYISIAKILNFHGIKGEAKLGFSKGGESRIENLKHAFIKQGDDFIELNVISVRFHKHYAIVKFKEFETVNDVEKYKGNDIFLSKEEVEAVLDNNEYLISDLIGMNVYDEDGACLGVINAVGENPANNILSVKDNNGKNHLVPFVKDLVPVVDLKGRKVVINNIEGLIS